MIRITLLLVSCRFSNGGDDGLDFWERDPKFDVQSRRLFDPAKVSLPPNLKDSLLKANELLKRNQRHGKIFRFRSGNLEPVSTVDGNKDEIFQDPDATSTSPKPISHALLWVTTPKIPTTTKEYIFKKFSDAIDPRAVYHRYRNKYNHLYDVPGYNNPRHGRRPPKNRDSRISHYVSKEHHFGNFWKGKGNSEKHKDKSVYSGSQSRETTDSTKKKLNLLRSTLTKDSSTTTMTAANSNNPVTHGIYEAFITDANTESDSGEKSENKLLRHKKYDIPAARGKTAYKPIKNYKLSANNVDQKRHKEFVEAASDTLDPYNIHKHFSQEKLDCEFPEANFDIQVIGKTISRNDILLLKIQEKESDLARHFRAQDKYADDTPEKKIIFIVHGLSSMGIHKVPALSKVKKFYKLMKTYTKHLEEFDFYVIPNANPDGFQASAPSAADQYGREWNKNQSPQEICAGVALDRNFDIAWNETKQVSACNQFYPGPVPFSEPESEAVRQIIHKYSSKLLAYIHVHASTYDPSEYKGDAILYPKGYTDVVSEDDRYIDLRGEIEEEMSNAGFRILTFTVDTLNHWYKKVTGTSVDYASSIYGIPYTMEFLMQSYENHTADAFKEIWERVIDVTMNHMYNRITKSTKGV